LVPAEHLRIIAGNRLPRPLPSGDAYVLSQVLHDWADEGAAGILYRCAEAGRDDARVLIVEGDHLGRRRRPSAVTWTTSGEWRSR
jgi:hypothetical protein